MKVISRTGTQPFHTAMDEGTGIRLQGSGAICGPLESRQVRQGYLMDTNMFSGLSLWHIASPGFDRLNSGALWGHFLAKLFSYGIKDKEAIRKYRATGAHRPVLKQTMCGFLEPHNRKRTISGRTQREPSALPVIREIRLRRTLGWRKMGAQPLMDLS